MKITPYHAKYYAHEISHRNIDNSPARIAPILAGAKVDLNPHQIEAALFALRSPFSRGVLLADEVGLGKTIEAGILIAQKWAELKRTMLIIVPASLRKQWSQELQEKFYLPSTIIDGKTFQDMVKSGNKNPFNQHEKIVICSYNFAYNKSSYVQQIPWDLVIIDEAHRLRNVYKKDNKIAKGLKETLESSSKILLTATPLQNSLLELYGLVSFIDEHRFGDLSSYKNQYSHITTDGQYQALKDRLAQVCNRTLRRQVLEYIKYTKRHSITQKFNATKPEQQLHDWIVEYLQRDKLYVFSSNARYLITLILLKLLTSSTRAIAGTLDSIIIRLEAKITNNNILPLEVALVGEFEGIEEIKDEEDVTEETEAVLTEEELEEAKLELAELKQYCDFAHGIKINSKAQSLLPALLAGFKKTQDLGGKKKAVIFTESRRTQEYLFEILNNSEYKDKVVLFNGTNADKRSNEIYSWWRDKYHDTDRITGTKQTDIRSAIVDYFREQGQILIATEAAAEGINLQFCSLVINYDLPWNPQRVEQRIGRCHRYGQKYDVVVVNFLNESNLADKRIYELLDEKFKLFDGVFGSSDEILGSIESGVDLEHRIVQIYQECRTQDEIEAAFSRLQKDLESQIDNQLKSTRKTLLENFDEEVEEKLKVRLSQTKDCVTKLDKWLWEITQSVLDNYADFNKDSNSFHLHKVPSGISAKVGNYSLHGDGFRYHLQHPLAQYVIDKAKSSSTDDAKINYYYTDTARQITILNPLINKRGYLKLSKLVIKSLEEEDHLIFTGFTENGDKLTHEQCMRMFSLPGKTVDTAHEPIPLDSKRLLTVEADIEKKKIITLISQRNAEFFEEEIDKLDNWADDKRNSLKSKLKEYDDILKELKKESRMAPNLPAKLKLQKKIRQIEQKRDQSWQNYDKESKKIETQKDKLIDTIQARLEQEVTLEELFTIQWEIL